ncbi:hypothetical protein THS27_06865 [Thalassospira sp. MCCC 1A01428]|nr:hypothetical protein THS27_06865 [Thalassospira sp. MCCC 1A01428]
MVSITGALISGTDIYVGPAHEKAGPLPDRLCSRAFDGLQNNLQVPRPRRRLRVTKSRCKRTGSFVLAKCVGIVKVG